MVDVRFVASGAQQTAGFDEWAILVDRRHSVVTVIAQRVGRLDETSLTERTSPVTNEPSIVNVALSFRYCANRQRRARV